MADFYTKALEHAPYLVICILGMLAFAKILGKDIKAASERCHDVTDRTLTVLQETGKIIGANTEAQREEVADRKETRKVLRECKDAIIRANGKI